MKFIFEKREKKSKKLSLLVPFISFFFSLLLGAIVLLLCKVNPFITYANMVKGALGTKINLYNTIIKTVPLLLCGLGIGVAFRLKFWNIGGEGQFVAGVIGTTWVILSKTWVLTAQTSTMNITGFMMFWSWLPYGLVMPVALLVGMLSGGLWGAIPGALKAKWSVDETLSTLMMNYIIIYFADFLFYSKWKAPEAKMGTPLFPKDLWLASWGLGGKLHIGIIIALVLVVILWFVLYKTKWGFELNMIGNNRFAARCQGVSIKKNMIFAMLVSGAICGLAGSIEVTGVMHRLTTGVASGYGFTGIIVAWMSGLNPFVSIIFAFILAILKTGSVSLQLLMKLDSSMGDVLQGLILLPLLAGSIFTEYKLKIKKGPGR